MKLRLIAFAALATASGISFAATKTLADGTVVVDAAGAGTVVVRMSGATALRNVVAGEALSICGGAGSTNGGVRTTTYNFTPPSTFSNNLWAISCRTAIALGSGATLLPIGTDVVFMKTDQGGSAQGVFPLALPLNAGTARPFLSTAIPTGCATTTGVGPFLACPAGPDAAINMGISDLEPAAFKGDDVPSFPQDPDAALYPSGGLSFGQLQSLTITPVVQTVFAVAVNQNLYNEMFLKQGLNLVTNPATGVLCTNLNFDVPICTPSIGYAAARTFFGGVAANWSLLVRGTDPLIASPINICRRTNGSGTQAASNYHLRQSPQNTAGALPTLADWSYSTVVPAPAQLSVQATAAQITQYLTDNIKAPANGQPAGQTFVFEGPSTGNVTECLIRANTVGGYALGHVSKENAPGANAWRHVKLEGAFPSRDNLKNGDYDYAFESTVQWVTNLFNALPANNRNYITGMTNRLRSPAALTALSATAQQGVAALPDNCPAVFGTGTAAEQTFCSRVTRGGNSATPFSAVK